MKTLKDFGALFTALFLCFAVCQPPVRAEVVVIGRGVAAGGGGGSITVVSTGSVHSTAEGTALTVPLGSTATAGHVMIIYVVDANVISTPSGFTQDHSFPDDCEAKVFRKTAAGGETSVAVTTLTGHGVGFGMLVSGLDSSPKDQVATEDNETDPLSAGTTPATTVADELIIACAAYPAPGGVPTLSAGPGGYTTLSEVSTGAAGSFGLVAGHFAYKIVSATGAQTASFDLSSATPGGASGSGGIVTYKKAP